ncbi:unnamed protein product [Haemonchus placei]|uniref:Ovule protein n=1 Tax=Haemonchus placei TaxID=6290 RepID=A0A0N4WM89_HAEPC|nr:unnamed protein product [Haemonchus placei]
MTFESADIVYLSLCYTEWPSSSGSFLQSPCLFHPYPYNFTITPGHPTKIGRPLRHMHSVRFFYTLSNSCNHFMQC